MTNSVTGLLIKRLIYLDPLGDGGGPGPPGQQRVVQEEAGVLEAGADPGVCAGNAAGSAS